MREMICAALTEENDLTENLIKLFKKDFLYYGILTRK
jgi:hypothetical protein